MSSDIEADDSGLGMKQSQHRAFTRQTNKNNSLLSKKFKKNNTSAEIAFYGGNTDCCNKGNRWVEKVFQKNNKPAHYTLCVHGVKTHSHIDGLLTVVK